MPAPVPRNLNLPPTVSLAEARRALALGAVIRAGVVCPCCEQQATVYRRHVTLSMVRVLWLLYRFRVANGDGFAHVPTLFKQHRLGEASQGGDWAKSTLWCLIEREEGEHRTDGSNRTGLARITDSGVAFLAGNYRIRSTAWVYNNTLLAKSGRLLRVSDVRGFSYEELFGDTRPTSPTAYVDEPPFMDTSHFIALSQVLGDDEGEASPSLDDV